jgi:glycosyltransferase involved in cell wall biosynthesis
VGTLEPRKNLPRLIEAQGAAFPVTGMPLILAGRHGWGVEGVLQTVRESQGAVEWLGPVSDGELAWLYANAFAAIQFSRDEGFDYPAVEAMRAGIPVLLSDIAVHREVGPTAALYAAPHDVAALTALMIECAGRPGAWRLAAGAAGKARAAELAAQTRSAPYLAVYEQAMSAQPSSPVCSGRSA